jgi:hypothetical protein
MNTIVMPLLFRVYKLFNFIYKKFNPGQPVIYKIQEQLKKESPGKNNGDGVFSFQGYGFSVKIGQDNPIIFWTDIQAIFLYTENRLGTDCVCLEVLYKKGESFKVSELTPGWLRFLDKIAEHFPAIDKCWQVGIDQKRVLVYEKANLVLEKIKCEATNKMGNVL